MKQEKKYITDSSLEILMERLEEKEENVKAEWKDVFTAAKMPKTKSACGNVRVKFNNGKAALHSDYKDDSSTSAHDQISSALALYRAISVFECGVDDNQDFYKCNWSVTIKHKETGLYLVLGEWKGGFQIFTEFMDVKEMPKAFRKDVEAFLTWFVSNKVSINYDGVVAGTVA